MECWEVWRVGIIIWKWVDNTASQTSPHTPEYWEYCTLSKHPRLSGSDLWFCKQSEGSDLVAGITDAISFLSCVTELVMKALSRVVCLYVSHGHDQTLWGYWAKSYTPLLLVLNVKLKPKDVSVCCSLLMVSLRNMARILAAQVFYQEVVREATLGPSPGLKWSVTITDLTWYWNACKTVHSLVSM